MDRIIEPTKAQLEFSSVLPSVVLASSSPNRKALLEAGGTNVRTFSPDVDETLKGKDYEDSLLSLAELKLESYLESPLFDINTPAIAADTMVLIDNRLLGKAKDRSEAKEMLMTLSGRVQTVLTASAFYLPVMRLRFVIDKAEVKFKTLSENEIESYLDTDEWVGAAGAYRIQKTGYRLVDTINGDWSTVVGLPLRLLTKEALGNAQSR